MMKTGQHGFTLIEVMITVAIVAILGSIAYPSYQAHIRKTKEAEAKAALVSFATAMSQFYLDDLTYIGAGSSDPDKAKGKPWIFSSKVPIDGGDVTYNLTIKSADKTSYVLKATPVDSSLKTYCIDELGTKTDCNGNNNW